MYVSIYHLSIKPFLCLSSYLVEGVLPRFLVVKNPPDNWGDAGDMGLIPGSERSPGGWNGNPLQYSCLDNPMDREVCKLQSMGVTKSQMWLSTYIVQGGDQMLCLKQKIAFYLSKNLFPSLDFASLQGNSYHYKEIKEYTWQSQIKLFVNHWHWRNKSYFLGGG